LLTLSKGLSPHPSNSSHQNRIQAHAGYCS
jgi:hypothetical protein